MPDEDSANPENEGAVGSKKIHAGFWIRLAAYLIDYVILDLLLVVFSLLGSAAWWYLHPVGRSGSSMDGAEGWLYILYLPLFLALPDNIRIIKGARDRREDRLWSCCSRFRLTADWLWESQHTLLEPNSVLPPVCRIHSGRLHRDEAGTARHDSRDRCRQEEQNPCGQHLGADRRGTSRRSLDQSVAQAEKYQHRAAPYAKEGRFKGVTTILVGA